MALSEPITDVAFDDDDDTNDAAPAPGGWTLRASRGETVAGSGGDFLRRGSCARGEIHDTPPSRSWPRSSSLLACCSLGELGTIAADVLAPVPTNLTRRSAVGAATGIGADLGGALESASVELEIEVEMGVAVGASSESDWSQSQSSSS